MLNEIFKGMDNASEAINENFQNGSIVESNFDETSPENGYFVRFGNGLQVCWHHEINTTFQDNRTLETTWVFAKKFIGLPSVSVTKDSYFTLIQGIPASQPQPSGASTQIRVFDPQATLTAGITLKVSAIAIGIYK